MSSTQSWSYSYPTISGLHPEPSSLLSLRSKPLKRFPNQPNQLCCSHSRAFPSHQIMRATSPHIVFEKKKVPKSMQATEGIHKHLHCLFLVRLIYTSKSCALAPEAKRQSPFAMMPYHDRIVQVSNRAYVSKLRLIRILCSSHLKIRDLDPYPCLNADKS